jgi:hypothetical protein
MRSQKISNRAPRPFKTHKDKNGWGGGNRNGNFIPAPKHLSRVTKQAASINPTEPPPPEMTEGH